MLTRAIVLFFFISKFSLMAQNNEGYASYKLRLSADFYKQIKEPSFFINGQYYLDNKFNYFLKFNATHTSFDVNKKSLENLEKEYEDLMGGTYIEKNYFDIKKNSFFINNAEPVYIPKNEYLIEREANMQWNITKEEKTINDYKCYKATSNYKYIALNGKDLSYTVEAWFCPTINLPYGPVIFHGLPGLIIEVNVDDFYKFELEKIVFEPTKIDMSDTKKLKKVTFEEYKNIILEMVNEARQDKR